MSPKKPFAANPPGAVNLAELTAEYRRQYRPGNPTERFLVETVVHYDWRLRRLRCVEAELPAGDALTQIRKLIDSCQRAYERSLKVLQRLKAAPLPRRKSPESKPISLAQKSHGNIPRDF